MFYDHFSARSLLAKLGRDKKGEGGRELIIDTMFDINFAGEWLINHRWPFTDGERRPCNETCYGLRCV